MFHHKWLLELKFCCLRPWHEKTEHLDLWHTMERHRTQCIVKLKIGFGVYRSISCRREILLELSIVWKKGGGGYSQDVWRGGLTYFFEWKFARSVFFWVKRSVMYIFRSSKNMRFFGVNLQAIFLCDRWIRKIPVFIRTWNISATLNYRFFVKRVLYYIFYRSLQFQFENVQLT